MLHFPIYKSGTQWNLGVTPDDQINMSIPQKSE